MVVVVVEMAVVVALLLDLVVGSPTSVVDSSIVEFN